MIDPSKSHTELLQELKELHKRVEFLEKQHTTLQEGTEISGDEAALFRQAFQEGPDLSLITRLTDGQIVKVSNAFLTATGYAREALIGQSDLEIGLWLNPEDRGQLYQSLQQVGQVENLEAKLRLSSGKIITGSISAKTITADDEAHIIWVIRDITAWRQSREKMAQHNRRLELLNRIIAAAASGLEPDIILETTCREVAMTLNVPQVSAKLFSKDKTRAMLVAIYSTKSSMPGYDQIDDLGKNPIGQYLLQNKAPLIVNDIKNDPRIRAVRDQFLAQSVVSLLTAPLIIENEVVGCLEITTSQLHSFSPEEVSLAWSVADQAAGALNRAWLNEERHLLSTAIEQAADSVIVSDYDGTILYVNPAFEQITGYRRSEVVGQASFLMVSGEQEADFNQKLWDTLRKGDVWHGHITNQKPDGTPFTVEATIAPIRDEKGGIVNYVSTQRDVTRELELEKRYRQSQKMEAIGQLTAGIAHDFNNLLMAINGFAELMQFKLPPDSPFQDMASRILASGESAANLIRQLLIFSRKQIAELQIMDLNQTISEIDKMLHRIIGEHIDLQNSLAADLWSIKLDPTQIEQIIVNMAVNARDAMPTGGRLSIETANVTVTEEDAAAIPDLEPGDYVMLTIQDSGVGMNQAISARAFEPFFTTKEQGKGTGLGLATVYSIVKQCGGSIRVDSRVDEGTTFDIYFPRAVESDTTPLETRPTVDSPQGDETILLVEDSSAVQELVAMALHAQGYKVLRASHGEEAFRLFQNYEGDIDLLLTDVVMPHMNGKELYNRIIPMRPGLKVIFTSGYTHEFIAHYGLFGQQGINFLQKPFSPTTLVTTVREVLDTPSPSRSN